MFRNVTKIIIFDAGPIFAVFTAMVLHYC